MVASSRTRKSKEEAGGFNLSSTKINAGPCFVILVCTDGERKSKQDTQGATEGKVSSHRETRDTNVTSVLIIVH